MDDDKYRSKNVNSIGSFVNSQEYRNYTKGARGFDSLSKDTSKKVKDVYERISPRSGVKEINSSIKSITKKLEKAIDLTVSGLKTASVGSLLMTKEAVRQFNQSIGQDISINKTNFIAMTLGQATPIFGYFAAKFMETDIFKNTAIKIKDTLGDAITFVAKKFKYLLLGSFEKTLMFLTWPARKLKSIFSKNKEIKDEVAKTRKEIPKMAVGGYVEKGGIAQLHPAEVVMPVDKLFHNLVKYQKESSNLQVKNIVTAFDKSYSKQQGPDLDLVVRKLVDLRSAMIVYNRRIAIDIGLWWERFMEKHPGIDYGLEAMRIMGRAITSPFRMIFKARGGYEALLPDETNQFANITGTLGLIFTHGMYRLDDIRKLMEQNVEATRHLSMGLLGSKYEKIKRGQVSEPESRWRVIGELWRTYKEFRPKKPAEYMEMPEGSNFGGIKGGFRGASWDEIQANLLYKIWQCVCEGKSKDTDLNTKIYEIQKQNLLTNKKQLLLTNDIVKNKKGWKDRIISILTDPVILTILLGFFGIAAFAASSPDLAEKLILNPVKRILHPAQTIKDDWKKVKKTVKEMVTYSPEEKAAGYKNAWKMPSARKGLYEKFKHPFTSMKNNILGAGQTFRNIFTYSPEENAKYAAQRAAGGKKDIGVAAKEESLRTGEQFVMDIKGKMSDDARLLLLKETDYSKSGQRFGELVSQDIIVFVDNKWQTVAEVYKSTPGRYGYLAQAKVRRYARDYLNKNYPGYQSYIKDPSLLKKKFVKGGGSMWQKFKQLVGDTYYGEPVQGVIKEGKNMASDVGSIAYRNSPTIRDITKVRNIDKQIDSLYAESKYWAAAKNQHPQTQLNHLRDLQNKLLSLQKERLQVSGSIRQGIDLYEGIQFSSVAGVSFSPVARATLIDMKNAAYKKQLEYMNDVKKMQKEYGEKLQNITTQMNNNVTNVINNMNSTQNTSTNNNGNSGGNLYMDPNMQLMTGGGF